MRLNTPANPIEDWNHVNEALMEIAELTRGIDEKRAVAKRRIDHIETELDAETRAENDRRELVIKNVEHFVTMRRKDFAPAKSKKLPAGRVGFRQSTAIVQLDEWTNADVVSALVANDMLDCIRTKDYLSRKAVKAYSEDARNQVGLMLELRNRFFVEANPRTDQGVVTRPGKAQP